MKYLGRTASGHQRPRKPVGMSPYRERGEEQHNCDPGCPADAARAVYHSMSDDFQTPMYRLNWVPRDSLTAAIRVTKIPLRRRVTLFGGLAVPAGGLRIIQRHSPAPAIRVAHVELRRSVSLFGGLAVPAGGLSIVLRHALTVFIHVAEAFLSRCVTLVGGSLVPANSLGGVLRHRSE